MRKALYILFAPLAMLLAAAIVVWCVLSTTLDAVVEGQG